MTEQEEKMWQDDLDMISKLNKEVDELHNKIDKVIEILKLCNSQCAKETIEILKGKE